MVAMRNMLLSLFFCCACIYAERNPLTALHLPDSRLLPIDY
jgi:hypothetical protein